jgi:prophage regulatory protein
VAGLFEYRPVSINQMTAQAMKYGATPSTVLEKLLRERSLIEAGYIPFSHATLWRKVRDGSFPRPLKLSAGVTAWRESDVLDWQRTQGVTA